MNLPDFIEPYLSKNDGVYKVSKHILGVAKNVRAEQLDGRDKERRIIMFSGLSGSGKDSIVNKLTSGGRDLVRVKTMTTREVRPEEEENDPYERVTVGAFEDYLRKGQIIESTEYAGNFYGTKRGSIEDLFASGKTPILLVDPRGANFYLNRWKNGDPIFKNATLIYIFVIPPSMKVLEERLLNRSRDPEFVLKRMKQSQNDITRIADAELVKEVESLTNS
jgi:guanylate kinase